MMPYLDRCFGNPSSVHAAGREARAAIDNARDKLAALLRIKPHEMIFTGGGTESCNLAVLGLARSRPAGGLPAAASAKAGHIISAKTEHHAVLNAVEHLEKHEAVEVTWLDVSRDGIVDVDQLAKSIRPETRLVSIMTANNETGVIQPMREISNICRERSVLLHSDMVQSFGKINIDVSLVDAASFAAHKFYGPKGAGFLFLGVARFARHGIANRARAIGGSSFARQADDRRRNRGDRKNRRRNCRTLEQAEECACGCLRSRNEFTKARSFSFSSMSIF